MKACEADGKKETGLRLHLLLGSDGKNAQPGGSRLSHPAMKTSYYLFSNPG